MLPAVAQDNVFKIGLILPMTGQQATTGRQIEAAARLYMAQNGDTVAGKKVQLIIKDDTSLPDVTRRLAQELVVNEKVNVLAGMGITPSAISQRIKALEDRIGALLIQRTDGPTIIRNMLPGETCEPVPAIDWSLAP